MADGQLPGKRRRLSYTPGDFQVAVKRASAGLGLFALEAIPKRACIIEYVGRMISAEEWETSNSVYLFDVGLKGALDGSPRWNKARYINHSCDPNCEPNIHNHRVFIHALRDIQPGEELTYDYGSWYFDAYIGADKCRCLTCKAARELAQAAG